MENKQYSLRFSLRFIVSGTPLISLTIYQKELTVYLNLGLHSVGLRLAFISGTKVSLFLIVLTFAQVWFLLGNRECRFYICLYYPYLFLLIFDIL